MNFTLEFEAQSNSLLAEAIANDDEALDEYIKQHGMPRSSGKAQVRLSEYTPELAALSDMHEMMQSNLHGVFKKKGRPKIGKMPRPETAMARAKKRKRRRNIEHIESMLVFSNELYNSIPDDDGIGRTHVAAEKKPKRGMRRPE